MRDFPSCFGENGVQIADSSSSTIKTAQSLVTSIYQCWVRGRTCLITLTWSKNLMGQGFSVSVDDSSNHCLCKVDIKPWLFSKRKGSKTLDSISCKIDIFWDISSAKFGTSPEPLEGFYVGIVADRKMVLFLGNLRKEAFKKTNITPMSPNFALLAKREHIFGKKVFSTKARFYDTARTHDLVIECDTVGVSEPWLVIRIDSKTMLKVKRLHWNFRGNQTVLVDGLAVEVFWDVHNWLTGSCFGNAVFMFKTCLFGEKVPDCWDSYDLSSTLSWSFSQRFSDSRSQGLGFSLTLHAWKNE